METKMISLNSVSYPYLAVAKRYDVDYRLVLYFLDLVEKNYSFYLNIGHMYLMDWQLAVLDKYTIEMQRRKNISGV